MVMPPLSRLMSIMIFITFLTFLSSLMAKWLMISLLNNMLWFLLSWELIPVVVTEPNNGSTREVKYQGVRKRPWEEYVVEIQDPNKKSRVWLGTFESVEDAARLLASPPQSASSSCITAAAGFTIVP